MAKRKMNPNSLKNLAKGKEYEFKQGEKKPIEEIEKREQTKKENRIVEETCLKWIDKNFGISSNKLEEYIKSEKVSPETLLKIMQFFAEYSGQKPVEKQQIIGGDLKIEVHND